MKSIITASSLVMLFAACQPEPKPIQYGEAACDYCRMGIVDERFGCELVSTKGKAYFFDALECQIQYRLEHSDMEWSHSVSSTFNEPEVLLPTTSLYILRSSNMPSPMGMYLNAFSNETYANEFQASNGGEIYSYEQLLSGWDQLEKL